MSDVWRSEDGAIELRLGRWQDVLGNVRCDALCTDPPYGERTHSGQRHGRKDARYTADPTTLVLAHRGLQYTHWTDEDATAFAESWGPRTAHWTCILTSHDLVPVYSAELESQGRYVFAPLSCVQHAMNVRLAGDGPANWTVHLVATRPRSLRAWGALPGAYVGPSHDSGENALDRSKRAVAGAKPLWLMRAIIRDYSRPGDLICDPCAGGATTLLAARMEGRRAIGAEMDPETFRKAVERLEKACRQRDLFTREDLVPAEQHALALDVEDDHAAE